MKSHGPARSPFRRAIWGFILLVAPAVGCQLLDMQAPAGPYVCNDGMWCTTYSTGVVEARVATLAALAEMHMPVVWEGRVPLGFGIDTMLADGSHVRISFEALSERASVQGEVTSVGVRVGGFGTHQAACERILDEIGRHGGTPPPSPIVPTSATQAPTVLPALPAQPLPAQTQAK
jgi:Protein of unknown function (DUF3568)